MALILLAGMHVAARIDRAPGSSAVAASISARGDLAAGKRLARLRGEDRPYRRHCRGRSAPALQRPSASSSHRAGDADDGEVAAPARDLHEAGSRARRRDRQFHFHQHLIGRKRGRQRADEKIRRVDPAFAAHRLRAQPGRRARARWPASPRPDRHARGCRRWCRDCGSAGARCAAAPRERAAGRARWRRRARGCDSASAHRYAGFARRSSVTPAHSVSGLMSISIAGCVSRKFIVGTRLWPPARNRASSPCSAFNCKA